MMTMNVDIYTATKTLKLKAVPAKLKERNYNPCFDVVLVPDIKHPACPKVLVDALSLKTLVGPMMSGWEEIGLDKIRVMGRYEDQATYDRSSN